MPNFMNSACYCLTLLFKYNIIHIFIHILFVKNHLFLHTDNLIIYNYTLLNFILQMFCNCLEHYRIFTRFTITKAEYMLIKYSVNKTRNNS